MQQVASGGWSTECAVLAIQFQRVGKNVGNSKDDANGTKRCVGDVGGDNPVGTSVIVGDHGRQNDGPELYGRIKNKLSEWIQKTWERHFPQILAYFQENLLSARHFISVGI